MTNPAVTIAQSTDDGVVVAFLHIGQKVRAVFAATKDDLYRRLVNVHIAEFGFNQADAEAASKAAITVPPPPAVEPAEPGAPTPALVADLENRLTEMLQRALKAESDLSLAKSEITDLKVTLAKVSPADVSEDHGAADMSAGEGSATGEGEQPDAGQQTETQGF